MMLYKLMWISGKKVQTLGYLTVQDLEFSMKEGWVGGDRGVLEVRSAGLS